MKAKIQYYGELRLEDKALFTLGRPLDLPWYRTTDKTFMKHKLGKLLYGTMQQHQKEEAKACVVRFINFERTSAYTIESFDSRMISLLQIANVRSFWLAPMGYHIDQKLRLYMFYAKSVSLHELLHSRNRNESNFDRILSHESDCTKIRIKYEIAF